MPREKPKWRPHKGESTDAAYRGGTARRSVESPVIGEEQRGCVIQFWKVVNQRWEEPVDKTRPFEISKNVVMEAFKRVKANKGAAGIDGETITVFEGDLKEIGRAHV